MGARATVFWTAFAGTLVALVATPMLRRFGVPV